MVSLGQTDSPSACLAVPVLVHLGPAIDGAYRIRLVQQDPANCKWVPLPSPEGRNASVIERVSDAIAAGACCENLEDLTHYRGFGRLDASSTTGNLVAVPIDAAPGRLRQLAASCSLQFAALSALDDLLALDFGDEGSGG